MRPAPLRPAATVSTAAAQPQRYLTNDEAAEYLRLSPRTLEKQRVIGGSALQVRPARHVRRGRPRCLGRRPQLRDDFRSEYAEHHSADSRALIGGARQAITSVSSARRPAAVVADANSSTCSAARRHGAARQPGLDGLSVLLARQVEGVKPIDFARATRRSA